MSVAAEFKSSTEPDSETRPVLGPAGNRVRVSEFLEPKRKKETLKKPQQTRRLATRLPESVLRANASVDSSCSSDSSCSISSLKKANLRRTRTMEQKVLKSVKVAPEKVEVPALSRSRSSSLSRSPSPSPSPAFMMKRCDWITPNSDPLYASFHDEEWGVPVHDDRKLFELLVLSQALAELNWPTILNKRDAFRKLFDNYDIASVAKFSEKKILALKSTGKTLLSEPKLRAVVDNAKQILKVQEECGSFDNYCWSFVNHQPIRNGFRYVRQVPVKTPKAEVISKDLMRRGFRCVGATVVYSFMQVAGIVNDHLLTCFRYQACNSNIQKDSEEKVEETEVLAKALDKMCLSPV
ncbi:Methyladenine glycosylase [Macleaya cordata]|uniref:Methyladenine glycosylase n=1 Tax=Macleaya cordata TaxID=56857 RepID=A0A200Q262_MACCD|nr:Methyladenine glycosylase [Macleaya cordata]